MPERAFGTRAARVGEGGAPVGSARPLAEPIYQTTVWGFDDLAAVDDWYEGRASDTFLYYRNGSPNTVALERAVADLEGADVVTHSLAKYLGGHSVAVGGVAVGRRALIGPARDRLTRIGGTIGALDA